MPVQAYVNFNGNCREAVTFYAEVFSLPMPQIMTYGSMPPDPDFPLPDEARELVMHTDMTICDGLVMFGDVPPGMPYQTGNSIGLVVISKDMDELKAYFHKMKVGGTVDMDLQETFWSKCYGSVVDKFGINWQFSHDSGMMPG